jgi:2-dehydropantoate 2-reductase
MSVVWIGGGHMTSSTGRGLGLLSGKKGNNAVDDSPLENSRFLTDKERDKYFPPFTYDTAQQCKRDGIPVRAIIDKKGKLQCNFMPGAHSLVIGATGSGKTTTFINPMIQLLGATNCGSSMIMTDPKGELFAMHSKFLKERGYDVLLLDLRDTYSSSRWNPLESIWDMYQDYINAGKGIRVHKDSMDDYPDDQTPDVIFVCVKGYSIGGVIPFIKRVAGPETIVIPILNVFGTGAEMQKSLPGITVLDGCIYIWTELKEPGLIWMSGTIFRVVFGLRRDQKHLEDSIGGRLANIKTDLDGSGIDGVLSDNIERDALRKFSFVSPQGAIGLYYNVSLGAAQVPGEIRECFAGLVREISNLADAMGIGFGEDIVPGNLKITDSSDPEVTTSMQKDVAAGRQSEVDGLIYEVVRMGERHGVKMPLYSMIADELRSRGLQ